MLCTETEPRKGPAERPQHRCPRCKRWHSTWSGLARCRFRGLLWSTGNGPWAVVASCPPGVSLTLHETLAGARAAFRTIRGGGCGGQCRGHHRLVDLTQEGG